VTPARETLALLADALAAQAEVAGRIAALLRNLDAAEPADGLLSPRAAGIRLGISASQVRKLIRLGRLPGVRIGTSVRVAPAALELFARRCRARGPAAAPSIPSAAGPGRAA
jgi:excisionase family DNA binding protein